MSNQTNEAGTLYLVPTPIGNLEDITFRALNVMKTVAVIASEDTRNTQKLLNHFEITTKQVSFHEHNTQERIPQFIKWLKDGTSIAQVSDAGMPSISDPGKELVQACIAAGITVVPLPGANAALTGLIASGLAPQPFFFWGFLPRKPKEQKTTLTQLKSYSATLIFYESPYRIVKTLENLIAVLGGDRQVVLARELTKRYEEFIRGSLTTVLAEMTSRTIKGEFVILVAGASEVEAPTLVLTDEQVRQAVAELIQAGAKPNAAIKTVAQQTNQKKQEVYRIYHEL
ncbi:16S rRNA (cytidine(1402)-2'-O)-methyltransferase [Agrilactobacillus yilanensis]|uniref:Ribosomal RNA small subunit methyltransferase I n=1 Tax=Agrilactobacillus yilanensis TaxID=2485997 RepID=A0ABW4J7X5_9LACO|nr:16S rRNA (cytidine(1402)-2'-O)-methyltransferase [Agrilactobacillus yilanensis]